LLDLFYQYLFAYFANPIISLEELSAVAEAIKALNSTSISELQLSL